MMLEEAIADRFFGKLSICSTPAALYGVGALCTVRYSTVDLEAL